MKPKIAPKDVQEVRASRQMEMWFSSSQDRSPHHWSLWSSYCFCFVMHLHQNLKNLDSIICFYFWALWNLVMCFPCIPPIWWLLNQAVLNTNQELSLEILNHKWVLTVIWNNTLQAVTVLLAISTYFTFFGRPCVFLFSFFLVCFFPISAVYFWYDRLKRQNWGAKEKYKKRNKFLRYQMLLNVYLKKWLREECYVATMCVYCFLVNLDSSCYWFIVCLLL